MTARLERIVKSFQKPQREFCDYLMIQRNEEVHTCGLPFKAMSEAKWLPHYYEVCSILNEFLGKTLDDYFGADEAKTARQLIAARSSAKRGEIEKRVAAHRAVFADKPADEPTAIAGAQRAAATGWPHPATRTTCPACKSDALLTGSVEEASEPIFADGGLVIEQRFLASSLTCGACGLQLRDVEEIILGGVEPHYTLTVHTDLHEFFEPDDTDWYMNM